MFGSFTTRSIYLRLFQGAAVTHFKEVWHTYVPPRIKVFLWKFIRDRLPCSEQVTKCHDPSDGLCALCGALEDCNHIFFSCPIAKFMWAGVRELLNCVWNPARPVTSCLSLTPCREHTIDLCGSPSQPNDGRFGMSATN